MQDNQRLKWLKIGLFWVFEYNYRVIDKFARIGKYGFTRAFHYDKKGCYCGRTGKGWIFKRVRM